MEFLAVNQFTQQINDTNISYIKARKCFKVKVRNDSSGPIRVNGLVIEPQKEETFDGLPANAVFAKDFELDLSGVRNCLVFVTRYYYSDNCPD